ncbi:hypothetical protein A2631_03215 [Candidatus Daviesbacteria bacterium RIFCSPHIGHO2_01_FULL_44_29]|uniref:Uncharacterized protein n=1 Tax=Candidatus Daviesbacteria bacterium RIFCSPHIGHO2_02_FULL_43_12 TaxID=1797776 RepID=A0A1F5KKJ6_9BACT|nr:MAG: hypothetical protein A2631_03215 [Candidatus Daviesbacteria bacterium RIFCSPHIGHO2_01_FULL_44_29]OGE40306.1 MAG: hypothetical protein A3E86_03870 [Candidatus Daviesbacteria bacterium RIFCSPHIGHO2_12_FULL_47_45]OGE41394.1 MAG: hypothetical protein A3D25_02610 [Candidatus Daviesbacteria bacterium RIFCSPHIGHO2_02_FULL_43_12]OGE69595.1 MAG: hypothetical protein A3B55_04355 [Candidatus Daviesbacteria bacterium RIFCSPLOWO2_01_FULL_43_15]
MTETLPKRGYTDRFHRGPGRSDYPKWITYHTKDRIDDFVVALKEFPLRATIGWGVLNSFIAASQIGPRPWAALVVGSVAATAAFAYQEHRLNQGKLPPKQPIDRSFRRGKIENQQFGLKGEIVVYKGQPIELKPADPEKGSEARVLETAGQVVLVRMPELRSSGRLKKSSVMQRENLLAELYDSSLAPITADFDLNWVDYMGVILPTRTPPGLSKYIQDFPHLPLAQLLSHKEATLKDTQEQVALLTPAEFRRLSFRPQELYSDPFFKTAYFGMHRKLGDPKLDALVEEADSPRPRAEVDRYETEVKRHLRRLIMRALESYLVTSQPVYIGADSAYPTARRTNRSIIQPQRGNDHKLFALNFTEPPQRIDLGRLFGVQGLSAEEILKRTPELPDEIAPGTFRQPHNYYLTHDQPEIRPLDKRQMQAGRLAYALDTLLASRQPRLVNQESPTQKEIEESLSVLGLKVREQRQNLASLVNGRRTFARHARWWALRALPFALIWGLAQGAVQMTPPEGSSIKYGEIMPDTVSLPSEMLAETGDDYDRRWTVIPHQMSAAGYYTQSTSHEMVGAKWIANREGQKLVSYPTETSEVPHVELWTVVGDKTLRIPILNHTQVGLLRVQDLSGNILPYRAYQFNDGTIEVELGQADVTKGATVTVGLFPAETPQVKAVAKVEPIDTSKLSPEALTKLMNLLASGTSSQISYEQIAGYFKKHYHYQISSEHKKQIEAANSPEEKLNAVFKLEGCNCDVCSLGAVLSSSLVDRPGQYLNRARGYLYGVNGERERGSLDNLNAHGFVVDEAGESGKNDPTPNVDQDQIDAETRRFLDALSKDRSQNPMLPRDSRTPEAEIKKPFDWLGLGLKLSEGVVGLGLGWLAYRRISNYRSRKAVTLAEENITGAGFETKTITPENLPALPIQTDSFWNSLEFDEIQRAYSFLNWVSWGDGLRSGFKLIKLSPAQLADPRRSLQESIAAARVRNYLAHPNHFESVLALSAQDKRILRNIARRIVK